jgi:hypothetical protein
LWGNYIWQWFWEGRGVSFPGNKQVEKIEETPKKEGSPWRDEKRRGEVWRNKHFVPMKLKKRRKLK